MPARKFTDEQEREICRRYLAGESTCQLAAVFGVSKDTIGKTVNRNGFDTRKRGETLRKFTEAQEEVICQRYLAGENLHQLGKAYGAPATTIWNILSRNGVEHRGHSEARSGLNELQRQEVCRMYQERKTSLQIAAMFGVSKQTILKILDRNGIARRKGREAHARLSAQLEQEVCRRYEQMEGTNQLAAMFGVSKCTILKILDRNGIARRKGSGDSVQQVLDGTVRHARKRACNFYLFELARYADTHCKPGIAFDVEARSDDEYGDEALRLEFSTRAEAFFLEQAVLDATRGNAQCPAELAGWVGASEVRAMPADDLIPIVLRLADEMDNLGVWDFAARYVPMTAAQRLQCQQRALEAVVA